LIKKCDAPELNKARARPHRVGFLSEVWPALLPLFYFARAVRSQETTKTDRYLLLK
jgi:hypothetical protein